MFDKYLKKENLKPEHIQDAYNYLKEYASENNTTIKKILADEENIPLAAEYIHKKLPFAARMLLNKSKISTLITENFDFIKEEATKLEKAQKAQEKEETVVAKAEKPKKAKK